MRVDQESCGFSCFECGMSNLTYSQIATHLERGCEISKIQNPINEEEKLFFKNRKAEQSVDEAWELNGERK